MFTSITSNKIFHKKLYNDYLYSYEPECEDWNQEGGAKLWLIKQDSISSVTTNENGLVTSIELLNQAAWILFDKLDNLDYSITPNIQSRHGVTHACQITFTDPRVTSLKSDVYLKMANTPMAAVFLDKNGMLWLFGEEQPMKVSALKYGSSDGQYSITLSSVQKKKFIRSQATL